jgi:cation:H+ antiporter
MALSFLLLFLGLAILIFSGDFLVRGAVGVASKFNVSTLVIGMTIVAFGTSAPELIVSLEAAVKGHPEIAVGNVIGSNIANLALVLGATVLIKPIFIQRTTVRLDWPAMMLISLLLWGFTQDAQLSFLEGFILFLLLIGYSAFLVKSSNVDVEEIDENDIKKPMYIHLLLVIGGSVGLAYGADLLLANAVKIARYFNVSEYVIGTTIVAFGTSIPELITSVMAALKNQSDISIGNLIGSNMFNIGSVLGITAMVREIPFSETVVNQDIYWMLAISALIMPLMLIDSRMPRWTGGVLVAAYVLYIYIVI